MTYESDIETIGAGASQAGAVAAGANATALRAVASINLNAITANCSQLVDSLTAESSLCAVVKADGYGHGIVQSAQAAARGGATRLAVVTVAEAQQLASAQLGVPILIMAPLMDAELAAAIATGAELMAWERRQVEAISAAATASGAGEVKLHIKRDTGMGRYGARSDEQALDALAAAAELPNVSAHAVWTHFATADEPASAHFDSQLQQFTAFVALARGDHPQLLAHAANSAATLRTQAAHFDFVRCGIAIYGLDPQNRDATDHQLTPALTLSSYVATVRDFEAGDHASYGCRFTASQATKVATVPLGYGDGWPRILSNRCEVLIGGTRYRQVGTVSMDSIMVELGASSGVVEGDMVTLIGSDGSDQISAEVVANQAETINYEITCGLTARTTRRYDVGIGIGPVTPQGQ